MKGSLPITIGITGHRDLRDNDIPILSDAVKSILQSTIDACPSSPIYIISALADGADRLVAKCAIELGLHLIVPLPFQKSLYEKDFTEPGSLQEFNDLLAHADDWFELPLLSGSTLDDISEYGDARDKQYAYVGAYITRYSHFVIALWDGDPEEKVGGTAYVVGFKLRGIPAPYVVEQGRFEPEETGVVYQVVTPRKSHSIPTQRTGEIIVHYPVSMIQNEDQKSKYQGLLRDTNAYNADEVRVLPQLSSEKQHSKQWLSPELPNGLDTSILKSIREHFSSTDVLSTYYQRKTLSYFRVLFSCAMLATMSFEFYAYILIDEPFVLVFLFIVLLAAYTMYFKAARNRIQDKFQDYRTIAEGLRVQYYWQLAGIDDSVANNYLKDQSTELDWIRHALRSWTLPRFRNENTDPRNENLRWEIILTGWITDQYTYFAKSSVREMSRLKRLSRFANFFLIGGFSLIAANLIYHSFIGFSQHSWILFFASIMPIGAGLLYGYAEKRSLAEHARKYEKMAGLFAKAKKQVEESIQLGTNIETRRIIYDLGIEALKENGDWVMTHRNRPIEVPLA